MKRKPKSKGVNLRYRTLWDRRKMRTKARIWVIMMALKGRVTRVHSLSEYRMRYTLRVYVNVVDSVAESCESSCELTDIPVIVIYSVIYSLGP